MEIENNDPCPSGWETADGGTVPPEPTDDEKRQWLAEQLRGMVRLMQAISGDY